MKKLKNTMKRIATLGLAAVLLTNSSGYFEMEYGIDKGGPSVMWILTL